MWDCQVNKPTHSVFNCSCWILFGISFILATVLGAFAIPQIVDVQIQNCTLENKSLSNKTALCDFYTFNYIAFTSIGIKEICSPAPDPCCYNNCGTGKGFSGSHTCQPIRSSSLDLYQLMNPGQTYPCYLYTPKQNVFFEDPRPYMYAEYVCALFFIFVTGLCIVWYLIVHGIRVVVQCSQNNSGGVKAKRSNINPKSQRGGMKRKNNNVRSAVTEVDPGSLRDPLVQPPASSPEWNSQPEGM